MAVYFDAFAANRPVFRNVYGPTQQENLLPSQSAGGIAILGGVAGLFRFVFYLCGEFLRLCQYFRVGVCGGAEYVVAILLHFHCVLRRCAESIPDFSKKKAVLKLFNAFYITPQKIYINFLVAMEFIWYTVYKPISFKEIFDQFIFLLSLPRIGVLVATSSDKSYSQGEQ